MENIIRTKMTQAFWDLIKSDLDAEPQRFDHIIKLIVELKERLKKFTPHNQYLRDNLDEHIDPVFLKQLFEANVFDAKSFSNLVFFLIHKLERYCSPDSDKSIADFKSNVIKQFKGNVVYSSFLPWFLTEYHTHLDKIEEEIIIYLS
jgi:hypothetical protein